MEEIWIYATDDLPKILPLIYTLLENETEEGQTP
jgi:hypothetical protein